MDRISLDEATMAFQRSSLDSYCLPLAWIAAFSGGFTPGYGLRGDQAGYFFFPIFFWSEVQVYMAESLMVHMASCMTMHKSFSQIYV